MRTWVRIRPIGDGGHGDGEACEKELGDFDENAITILNHDQRDRGTTYDYMNGVFPVDCSQEDVADAVLPDLLGDFWGDKNVMIFAYGQTGTGKTHTMFGRPESLTMTEDNPGWGLLPRAVHATLRCIEERAAADVHSVLLLSAVEFYCYQVFDLSDSGGKQMCTMNGSKVVGNSYQLCDTPADLAEFIDRVYGNRQVTATAMNAGSSRSHTVIQLTLMTLDVSSQSYKQTTFSIVDLAGAERPEKASHTGDRMTKDRALMELWQAANKGTPIRLELQGYLINCELMTLLDAVVVASDTAKRGGEYKNRSGAVGGATAFFFQGALAGDARIEAVICLSQSPQNGWETWFSIAQYGHRLSELRTRIKSQPSMPIAQALKRARADAEEAAEALANQKNTPSAMKYAAWRLGNKVYTEQRLHFMQQLAARAGSAGAPDDEVGNLGDGVAAAAPAAA